MALATHGAAATRVTSSLILRDPMRVGSSSSFCYRTDYLRISTPAPKLYERLRPLRFFPFARQEDAKCILMRHGQSRAAMMNTVPRMSRGRFIGIRPVQGKSVQGARGARHLDTPNALDAGADIAKVQEWLSHVKISTTRYTLLRGQ
jgi:hypothetical protein